MRGTVWKQGDTWYYTVGTKNLVVAEDNTGNWRAVFDACFRCVVSFRDVTRRGHRIEKSYAQIVDEHRDYF